jgi:hypothetical protein
MTTDVLEAAAARAGVNSELIKSIVTATGGQEVEVSEGDQWAHFRFIVPGDSAPLAVDVLADTGRQPEAITYMLPSGGLNFEANFFTPREQNLANHLRCEGRVVIGLGPREDIATAEEITAEWGQAEHRQDAQRIVDSVAQVLPLPYELLGHSSGALLALDMAAADPSTRLRRVIALEIVGALTGASGDKAKKMVGVFRERLAEGVLSADLGLKGLIGQAVSDPDGVSAVKHPGQTDGYFTNVGLAHFMLINTGKMPGPLSWLYKQGYSAGMYTVGPSAAEDRFEPVHMPLSTWASIANAYGSGLVPIALQRDVSAAMAGDDTTYPLAWEKIQTEVIWINGALGIGSRGTDTGLSLAGRPSARWDCR